jgi:hypothetical protein
MSISDNLKHHNKNNSELSPISVKKTCNHDWEIGEEISPAVYHCVCKRCGKTGEYNDEDAQKWCSDDYH